MAVRVVLAIVFVLALYLLLQLPALVFHAVAAFLKWVW